MSLVSWGTMDSTIRSTADGGARRVERSAIAALAPLITVVPVSMIALAAFWWPIQLVWDIPYLLFVAGYIVFQRQEVRA